MSVSKQPCRASIHVAKKNSDNRDKSNVTNNVVSSCKSVHLAGDKQTSVSRGKDINNMKSSLKRSKHRGGLSHRIDMYFDDVKMMMKRKENNMAILTTEVKELKKIYKNDIEKIKQMIEAIQNSIKDKRCIYSSCSSGMETDSDIEGSDEDRANISPNVAKSN